MGESAVHFPLPPPFTFFSLVFALDDYYLWRESEGRFMAARLVKDLFLWNVK